MIITSCPVLDDTGSIRHREPAVGRAGDKCNVVRPIVDIDIMGAELVPMKIVEEKK